MKTVMKRKDPMRFAYIKPVECYMDKPGREKILQSLDKYNMPVIRMDVTEHHSFIYHPEMTFRRNNQTLYAILEIVSVIMVILGIVSHFVIDDMPTIAMTVVAAMLFASSRAGLFTRLIIAENVIQVPYLFKRISIARQHHADIIPSDEKTVAKCNKVASHDNLHSYRSPDSYISTQVEHHGDKLSIPVMIIHAMNIAIRTGQWAETDKIIGACCELDDQRRRYKPDTSLIETLETGIRDTYVTMMNMYEDSIRITEMMESTAAQSHEDYWKFVFGQQ